EVGFPRRETILASLSMISSGQDPISYNFSYKSPVMNKEKNIFLGFKVVKQSNSKQETTTSYLYTQNLQSLPTKIVAIDKNSPEVFKIKLNDYSGVHYKNFDSMALKKSIDGFNSSVDKIASWKEENFEYDQNLCTKKKTTNTQYGTLTSVYKFFKNDLLGSYNICFVSSIAYEGRHANHPNYDFSSMASIERNAIGLVTKILMDDYLKQSVEYDDQYRISALETGSD
ncbi:MAG: hypothetical protein HQK50_13030, partial [Oligoflexia bacterium]|nr:hypothetical protein [Oligoflexia bacterium]